MGVKAGWSTPMFHVADVERSIKFYEFLGFEAIDTEGCGPIGWARLHCEGGGIMLLRAEEGHAVDATAQGVILYLYVADLETLREQLIVGGIEVPPIAHPGYMPSGELSLFDPDGYRVSIGHWGEKEHQAWLKKIGREKV
jgi:hypothetical protein